MTNLTEGAKLPPQIRTSTPAEAVYESGSDEAAEELLRDAEAVRASLEKFRREGRSAFVSHAQHVREESPEQYITAEEYPELAEIWDNDADAVYDGM